MAFFRSSTQPAPSGAASVGPAPVGVVTVDTPVAKARLREAYDRGRVDERKRHHGSPVLTFILVLVALVGAVTLYYAFREGSFASGGAAVDNTISQVSSSAVPTVENAAAKAGAVAEQAGDKIKSQGEAIKQDGAAAANKSATTGQ